MFWTALCWAAVAGLDVRTGCVIFGLGRGLEVLMGRRAVFYVGLLLLLLAVLFPLYWVVVTSFGPVPPHGPGSPLPVFAYWKCQVNCCPTTLMVRSFGFFASTLLSTTQP